MENEQLERGRFEGEVLARLSSLSSKLDALVGAQTDHETRLRYLEDSGSKAKGYYAALSAVIATVISLVGVASDWFHK